MSCKISELRKQLESMQALLDTYEHHHVDSVTPEEKVIIMETKAKCIEAVEKRKRESMGWEFNAAIDEAIQAITDVE